VTKKVNIKHLFIAVLRENVNKIQLYDLSTLMSMSVRDSYKQRIISGPTSCAQLREYSANKNVFNRRLKAASVAFEFRTGSGRLFQVDGQAMAKARRPYMLSQWRGTCYS